MHWFQVLSAGDEYAQSSLPNTCRAPGGPNLIPAEVVLVALLSKFIFQPSDKHIDWNLSGIQFPSVGYKDPRPQLPMKVGFVKSS